MLCAMPCIPCMPGAAAAGRPRKLASGSTALDAPAKPGASGAALCGRCCIPPFPPEGRNMDCVPSETGNPVVGGEVGIRDENWEEVEGPAALGAGP